MSNHLQNSLSQMTINLKSDDYSYSSGSYIINACINVIANNNYTVKAKVFYSDSSSTPYSSLKAFTTNPSVPEILSAYGDARNSIFISIKPQLEVSSYSVILGYLDYNNSQQLDIIDNITTTDNTKRYIELTNLLQNVEYNISLIASNANGQSKISNTVLSNTKPQPDPITNLAGTFDNNADITLTWLAPQNIIHLPVDKYLIKDGDGVLLQTIDGTLTSFTFPQAFALNHVYSFQMVAVHSVGNVDFASVPSSIISINIPEPSEIRNLIISVDPSTLAITLSWKQPANNAIITTYSYNIMYNGLLLQNIDASITTISYSQTAPGGSYSFVVVPLHASHISSHTSSITVNVPSTGSPVNLTSVYDPSCNVSLNWSAPANNSSINTASYNVYDNSENLLLSTTALSCSFPNLLSGQSYTYVVKTLYGSYIGGSASTTVIIPVCAPAVSVSSSFDSTGNISIAWNYPKTMINIDNFAIFDIYNNCFSPSIPVSPSTANYFFSMGNNYPLGATYSFYIVSYNKGVASQASAQTSVILPIPSAPLNLAIHDYAYIPPYAALSWSAPANNNVITTNSYNVYQDGVLVHNVVQPSYNTASLVAGQTYSFVVKPLHGSVEFNSPATISLTAYQQSSAPINFVSQPKNNSLVLTWNDPTNIGSLTPLKYNLSYWNDNNQLTYTAIQFSNTGSYSLTITGLTNKKSYSFNLNLITITSTNTQVSGQFSSIDATPTGNPIITALSFSAKTLTATVDGNGSNLLSNFMIVSYDNSNVPTVLQYTTPPTSNGIYQISQLLPVSTVKCTLICANTYGITNANSF